MGDFSLVQLADLPLDLFVGGKAVPASDAGRFDVVDPATGDVVASVANGTVDDAIWPLVDARRRRRRGVGGDRHPVACRDPASCVRADDGARRRARPADLLENGKALADARGEVAYAAEFFRWYAEEAVRLTGTLTRSRRRAATGSWSSHQPVGVGVLVTPWNFPAAMATRKIGPALAAGCTVVLKPASETPLTALAMAGSSTTPGCRRVWSTWCPPDAPAPSCRRDAARPPGPQAVLHRLHRGRPDPAQAGGRPGRELLHGARRQRAVRGLRGRRPRRRRRRRDGREDAQRRRGLHRRQPLLRARPRRRGVLAPGWPSGWRAMPVGPGIADGTQVGPLVNEAARRKVDELVRDAVDAGAGVRRRRQAPRPARLLLPARPCSPTSPRARRSCRRRSSARWHRSSRSPTRRRRSRWPTTPSSVWSPTSTPATSPAASGSRAARGRHGRAQPRSRLRSGGPVRRDKQSGLGREGGHEGMLDYLESKYVAVTW